LSRDELVARLLLAEDQTELFRDQIKRGSIQKIIEEGIPALAANAAQEPHEDLKRSADVKMDNEFVTEEDLNFFKANALAKDGALESSSLLDEQKSSWNHELTYENEATVRNYVRALIKDALKSMTCHQSFQVFCEVTIFSLRPDLIVVMHPNLGVILVVEVKNPGEKVFTSKHIAGQIHDYLKGMVRLGHSTPFVVLCSYEEMVFARLTGTDPDREYREIVENSKELLKNASGKHKDSIAAVEKKPSTSPAGKGIKNKDASEPWIPDSPKPPEPGEEEDEDAAAAKDDDEKDQNPVIAYSQVFCRANVFKAMILAIECGIQSLNTVDEALRNFLPPQAEQVEVDLPFVAATSFKWKMCTKPLDYNQSSSNKCKRFHLLAELGRDQCGKVFLACDVFGRTCALKFYLEKPEDREQGKTSSEKKAEEMAKTELQRWKDLYPKFKECSHKLKLNHQIVLKMPYFTSVPVKKRLDMDVLRQVKSLLEQFQSKGLYYEEVRWRHVGCSNDEMGKLVVTMLDLGSLTSRQNDETEDYVRNHMTELIRIVDDSRVQELLKSLGLTK
jgi:hypothetical protein